MRPVGRVRLFKGLALFTQVVGQSGSTVREFPLERREARTTNWAPKHREPVLGSADFVAPSIERLLGFMLLGRDETQWRKSHYFS